MVSSKDRREDTFNCTINVERKYNGYKMRYENLHTNSIVAEIPSFRPESRLTSIINLCVCSNTVPLAFAMEEEEMIEFISSLNINLRIGMDEGKIFEISDLRIGRSTDGSLMIGGKKNINSIKDHLTMTIDYQTASIDEITTVRFPTLTLFVHNMSTGVVKELPLFQQITTSSQSVFYLVSGVLAITSQYMSDYGPGGSPLWYISDITREHPKTTFFNIEELTYKGCAHMLTILHTESTHDDGANLTLWLGESKGDDERLLNGEGPVRASNSLMYLIDQHDYNTLPLWYLSHIAECNSQIPIMLWTNSTQRSALLPGDNSINLTIDEKTRYRMLHDIRNEFVKRYLPLVEWAIPDWEVSCTLDGRPVEVNDAVGSFSVVTEIPRADQVGEQSELLFMTLPQLYKHFSNMTIMRPVMRINMRNERNNCPLRTMNDMLCLNDSTITAFSPICSFFRACPALRSRFRLNKKPDMWNYKIITPSANLESVAYNSPPQTDYGEQGTPLKAAYYNSNITVGFSKCHDLHQIMPDVLFLFRIHYTTDRSASKQNWSAIYVRLYPEIEVGYVGATSGAPSRQFRQIVDSEAGYGYNMEPIFTSMPKDYEAPTGDLSTTTDARTNLATTRAFIGVNENNESVFTDFYTNMTWPDHIKRPIDPAPIISMTMLDDTLKITVGYKAVDNRTHIPLDPKKNINISIESYKAFARSLHDIEFITKNGSTQAPFANIRTIGFAVGTAEMYAANVKSMVTPIDYSDIISIMPSLDINEMLVSKLNNASPNSYLSNFTGLNAASSFVVGNKESNVQVAYWSTSFRNKFTFPPANFSSSKALIIAVDKTRTENMNHNLMSREIYLNDMRQGLAFKDRKYMPHHQGQYNCGAGFNPSIPVTGKLNNDTMYEGYGLSQSMRADTPYNIDGGGGVHPLLLNQMQRAAEQMYYLKNTKLFQQHMLDNLEDSKKYSLPLARWRKAMWPVTGNVYEMKSISFPDPQLNNMSMDDMFMNDSMPTSWTHSILDMSHNELFSIDSSDSYNPTDWTIRVNGIHTSSGIGFTIGREVNKILVQEGGGSQTNTSLDAELIGRPDYDENLDPDNDGWNNARPFITTKELSPGIVSMTAQVVTVEGLAIELGHRVNTPTTWMPDDEYIVPSNIFEEAQTSSIGVNTISVTSTKTGAGYQRVSFSHDEVPNRYRLLDIQYKTNGVIQKRGDDLIIILYRDAESGVCGKGDFYIINYLRIDGVFNKQCQTSRLLRNIYFSASPNQYIRKANGNLENEVHLFNNRIDSISIVCDNISVGRYSVLSYIKGTVHHYVLPFTVCLNDNITLTNSETEARFLFANNIRDTSKAYFTNVPHYTHTIY